MSLGDYVKNNKLKSAAMTVGLVAVLGVGAFNVKEYNDDVYYLDFNFNDRYKKSSCRELDRRGRYLSKKSLSEEPFLLGKKLAIYSVKSDKGCD